MSELEQRFVDKTVQQGGCVLWTGALFENGYGAFQIDGKAVRAHRHAYTKTNGPIPAGMFVCHRCDVPACVNPEHLFLGTAKDNAQDRQAKGRGNAPRGERHGMAKLTQVGVEAIRRKLKRGTPRKEIAAMYGVSVAAVTRINTGAAWQRT